MSMLLRVSVSAYISSGLVLAALGCHGTDVRPSQCPDARATDASPASVRAPSSPDSNPQTARKLDDAEIVAITATAHGAGIEQSQVASARASDARVRDYAEMLLRNRAQARTEQAGLPFLPTASADSRRLERDAADAMSALQREHGRDFDRAYLQLQIEQQRDLLCALRDRLQPAAQQRQLRRYLAELVPQIEAQLATGERLRAELDGSSLVSALP